MSKSIRTILYEESSIGKRIKSTKRHFMWKFALDNNIFIVDLFASKLSGKKTIKINQEVRFEGKKQGKVFHISFDIGTHSILLIELGKGYDLRIDGISFQILQKQEIFTPISDKDEKNLMSDQLIPENQEDWEKGAKPYRIIIREGLNTTTREVLPIFIKKPKGRMTMAKNIDPRFLFSTESKETILEEAEVSKPRSLSFFGVQKQSNPFF
jgi:hypothetical protein